MKLSKSIIFGLAIVCLALITTTSCKKCKTIDPDLNTGLILSDVNEDGEEQIIIYPSVGYIAQQYGGNALVTSDTTLYYFEVSFDGGATRQLVDYNQFYLLAQPMNVGCNTRFDRDVSLNTAASQVIYNVTASSCESCEQDYHVENWVLVSASAIPGGYSVVFQNDQVQL